MAKKKKRSKKTKKIQYASFGDRFLANLIDIIIIITISTISFNLFLSTNHTRPNDIYSPNLINTLKLYPQLNLYLLIGSILLFLSFLSIYYLILWVAGDGQTIGFRILKIKLIRNNKEKISYLLAYIRFLTSCFSVGLLFWGVIFSFFNKEKRTWHDYICQTSVIKE